MKVLNYQKVIEIIDKKASPDIYKDVIFHKVNDKTGTPKVSIILLDWECRERFDTLDWLSKQDIPRDQYELIWIELYNRVVPAAMEKADAVIACGQKGLYHKHNGYNIGLLQAKGKIITICDSDAVYPSDFVSSILKAFNMNSSGEPSSIVLMHHQLRTSFLYPDYLEDAEELKDEGWQWWPLNPNVGACMSVRKEDALRFGGFDEHKSYRGYLCGPYDLGWRLVNAGVPEVWHDLSVVSWHFAHPDPVGVNGLQPRLRMLLEYTHPHVDLHALTAVESFSTGRLLPLKENPHIFMLRMKGRKIGSAFEEKYSSITGPEGFSKWQVERLRATMFVNLAWSRLKEFIAKIVCILLKGYTPRWVFNRLRHLKWFLIDLFGIKPDVIKLLGIHNNIYMVQYDNSVYGIPKAHGPLNLKDERQLTKPDVLKAQTLHKLKMLIDSRTYGLRSQTEIIESYKGYNIIKSIDKIYAVPRSLKQIELNDDNHFKNPEILSAETLQNVKNLIEQRLNAVAVEYSGWLPIYTKYGNCGFHPQFAHIYEPPDKYKFTMSNFQGYTLLLPLVILYRAAFLIIPIIRLSISSLKNGARIGYILKFIGTRGLKSQLMLPRKLNLLFLPSVPFTYGQHKWVIEIEDTISLFFPFVHNGKTSDMQIKDSPYFPIVKALIESQSCKHIVTHVKSTADSIAVLFCNDKLASKVTHVPIGVKFVSIRSVKNQNIRSINILFTNSWHQNPQSFYLRGGIDLLEAFSILYQKFPNINLTLRTKLPHDLQRRYLKIIRDCEIRVIDHFIPADEVQSIFILSDIYVLPAARIHVVSLLEAMANGLAVVTSDGWGIEEYVKDGRNGLIVRGRYGKCAWIDKDKGMLKENYEFMFKRDEVFVQGLTDTLSTLIEDNELRKHLGGQAKLDVEKIFNIENWNNKLKGVLDKALSSGRA